MKNKKIKDKIQELNGPFSIIDWMNEHQPKYRFVYNHQDQRLIIDADYICQSVHEDKYILNPDNAIKLIEQFGEENIIAFIYS